MFILSSTANIKGIRKTANLANEPNTTAALSRHPSPVFEQHREPRRCDAEPCDKNVFIFCFSNYLAGEESGKAVEHKTTTANVRTG